MIKRSVIRHFSSTIVMMVKRSDERVPQRVGLQTVVYFHSSNITAMVQFRTEELFTVGTLLTLDLSI